jgi:glycosyltransferase involved in cell wall biosynthesis
MIKIPMSKKDSVVFINQNAGYLMIDIINAHSNYNKRSIITGKLIERNISIDTSVKIEKIITYNRSSGFKRMFTWAVGFVQILWLIKTRYRKADLFIVTNPPFAGLLPLFCRNPFSILIYDVYPDVLVSYKFLSNHSFITKWWRKANQKVFKKALHIFTIAAGMKEVLSQYADKEKIKVVPLWADNRFLKTVPKEENLFIQQHQLQNKFLIIYSGNIGHSHSVEVLIEIAKKTTDPEVMFVIIGEGDKHQHVDELIRKYQLNNCLLLPWQNVTMLPHSLSAADLGVVTLGAAAAGFSIPSKTFSLLSVGAPLLCIADKTSELAFLVNSTETGKCFAATDTSSMIEYILLVKSDKNYRTRLKENALKTAAAYGPDNAFKFVEQE